MAGRLNVVLSRTPVATVRRESGIPDSVAVVPSLEHALHHLSSPDIRPTLDRVWILGGASLYEESMRHPAGHEVFLTSIEHDFRCDVFWNGVDESEYALDESYTRNGEENGVAYRMLRYVRRNPHPELAYLNLVRQVLHCGNRRGDRTGVGTLSQFGAQLRFDLQAGFPLLTTKKMFWKGVRDELLWFIAGDTNANRLAAKGVHIWDGNGSRQSLDARGLQHYPEGTLGPVYGFQWRHFGATYEGADADYRGKGFDQLADVVRLIRTDPNNRRILLSAWNPADLSKMVLPPCHVLCQFYVADGRLSSHLYQRSADLGLGVPFNIASYALLTHLIAHVCGLKAGEFVHSFGDAHVYLNHVAGMEEQLKRRPMPLPRLVLDPAVRELDSFVSESIQLENYTSHPAIKLDMAL
jgi:dihydrofolate reductase/thymidylate synthase